MKVLLLLLFDTGYDAVLFVRCLVNGVIASTHRNTIIHVSGLQQLDNHHLQSQIYKCKVCFMGDYGIIE